MAPRFASPPTTQVTAAPQHLRLGWLRPRRMSVVVVCVRCFPIAHLTPVHAPAVVPGRHCGKHHGGSQTQDSTVAPGCGSSAVYGLPRCVCRRNVQLQSPCAIHSLAVDRRRPGVDHACVSELYPLLVRLLRVRFTSCSLCVLMCIPSRLAAWAGISTTSASTWRLWSWRLWCRTRPAAQARRTPLWRTTTATGALPMWMSGPRKYRCC